MLRRCRRSAGPLSQSPKRTAAVWPIPYGIIWEAIRNNHHLAESPSSLHVCCPPDRRSVARQGWLVQATVIVMAL